MSRVSDSDADSVSEKDADFARQQLEAKLQRLIVNDEACSQANEALRDGVGGVVDQVNKLIALLGGTEEGGPNADPLLSYLEAERSYLASVSKHIGVTAPPLETRAATGNREPSEEESEEMQRLIAAVLDKGDTFSARSRERHCGELVGRLTGDYLAVGAVKPWSASEPRPAERPTELDRILFNVACAALPRLVETSAREWLSEVDNEEDDADKEDDVEEDLDKTLQASAAPATPERAGGPKGLPKELADLPKELARHVRLAAVLDVEEARCVSDILDLRAEFEKRAAIVRSLLAQQERLRRVQAFCEQRERVAGNVTRSVTKLRDHLAARVKQCESLIACANAQSHQEAAAAVSHDGESVADHGAALDKRCAELTDAASSKVGIVEQLENRLKGIREIVDRLDADVTASCQGSVETWCDGVKASTRRDENWKIIMALFVEFHTDPERFLRRMKGDAASTHAPPPEK